MSRLVVDSLQARPGNNIKLNSKLDLQGNYQPGEVIEVLTGICDGSVVTVRSGTYTLPIVTGGMGLTTAYVDITGSSISYTPPAGASRVIYEFSHQLSWSDDHAISHWKLYIDGTEVTDARHSLSGRYPERVEHHMWVFSIGTAITATGAQATWTTPKTIKLMAREYGVSNGNDKVHYTTYWDGTSGNQYSKPVLRITAIA